MLPIVNVFFFKVSGLLFLVLAFNLDQAKQSSALPFDLNKGIMKGNKEQDYQDSTIESHENYPLKMKEVTETHNLDEESKISPHRLHNGLEIFKNDQENPNSHAHKDENNQKQGQNNEKSLTVLKIDLLKSLTFGQKIKHLQKNGLPAGLSVFKCRVCSLEFDTKEEINKHLATGHEGIKFIQWIRSKMYLGFEMYTVF